MELKKLVLRNFRSHKRFTAEFKNGVSAIIGENGTGKSSLVEAIIFLFTGEGYGFKGELLTVGEATGYVLGHIDIEGKEAVLERHLDSSKVSLKYDGVVYKKSSEVAELWESLFQIDKNIFKNVVVAQQGDIPLLFSGDNSTKEKIFQKIFMVPNTGKLRDLIWDKYIKTAPPEYPLTDEIELAGEIKALEDELNVCEQSLTEIPENLDALRLQATNRINYLASCIQAGAQRKAIQDEITRLQAQKKIELDKLEKISLKLGAINIIEVTELLGQLKANKPNHEKRLLLQEQLKSWDNKKELFSQEESVKLESLDNEVRELQVKQSLVDIDLGNLNTQLTEYTKKGLLGQTNCPTCGGVLEDISQYLIHIQLKISQAQSLSQEYQKNRVALTNDLNVLKAKKNKADEYVKSTQELRNKLEALGACDFDQGTYDLYTAVAAQYNKLQVEQDEAAKCLSRFDRDILHNNMELIKLPEYDKAKKDMFVEKDELDKLLQNYTVQADNKLQLLQKTAVLRMSLELASAEIAKNKTLREKNMRRKNYVAVLQAIYDMFATAQFPRKLIQTYTDTVSAYLVENLRRFNFPYTVKVNGSFGIDVFDEKERLLPSVSGGQEIMIGIALRLALHSMFGAAFPMLILDEGSVHLSQESKKSYFQIIQELKKASNLKQIIIIDHDEELASVVDNTIKLN